MTLSEILEDTLLESRKLNRDIDSVQEKSEEWKLLKLKKRLLSQVIQQGVSVYIKSFPDREEAAQAVEERIRNADKRFADLETA